METKDILKELRKRKGYSTMQEFCSDAKINFSTYQNYETGKRLPTAEILMKLADFYSVTTDCLLGREPVSDPLPLLVARTNVSIEELEKQFNALPSEGKALMMTVIRMLKNNRETSNKE